MKTTIEMAMKKAFVLGQDYWYQADHESPRQNKKSDETLAKFRQHVDDTCEAMVEQPAQQEPVALLQEIARLHDRIKDLERDVEFLSLPVRRTWVGLTDEDIEDCYGGEVNDFARAIEARLKEKNNG